MRDATSDVTCETGLLHRTHWCMLVAELNKSRRMGVEFEMAVPLVGGGGANELRQTMARILTDNGLPAVARRYSDSPVPTGHDIAVEHDASIQGETLYRGIEWVPVEVKTRILDGVEDYDRVVRKLMDICRYLGARVNTSTGHHIHVEFAEILQDPTAIRSLFNIVHRIEPVLFGLVAASRSNNDYCRRLPDRSKLLHNCRSLDDYKRALTGAGLERHWAINMTHLFGTAPRIEWRHHGGTLDFEKARHWRNLCLRVIDHAVQRTCKATNAQLPNDQASLMRMLVTLGLKPNTRVFSKVDPELRATGRFLLKRWKAFNHGQRERSDTASTNPPSSTADGLPDFSDLR